MYENNLFLQNKILGFGFSFVILKTNILLDCKNNLYIYICMYIHLYTYTHMHYVCGCSYISGCVCSYLCIYVRNPQKSYHSPNPLFVDSFPVKLHPNAGYGLRITEISTSHKTTHHSR
jgi:hypothetical protein